MSRVKRKGNHVAFLRSLFALFFFSLCAQNIFADPSFWQVSDSITVSLNTKQGTSPDAFREKGSAINAVLYDIGILFSRGGYYSQYPSYNNRKATMKRISFKIVHSVNLATDSMDDVKLVRDSNDNGVYDEGENVSERSPVLSEKIISFNTEEVLEAGKTRYLLVGNFPALEDGAEVYVELEPRLLIAETQNSKDENKMDVLRVSGNPGLVKHREGNFEPVIAYRTDYQASRRDMEFGVAPREAYAGNTLIFGITYNDYDYDSPGKIEVWVDLNTDGMFNGDEKFPLSLVDDYQPMYEAAVQIIPTGKRGVMYRFYADDGKNEAIGEAISKRLLFIHRTVVMHGPQNPYVSEVVPGERFSLSFLVDFLFYGVDIDWDSIRQNDYTPFILEAVTLKSTVNADLNYNQATVELVFFAPSDLPFKETMIPASTIRYKWWHKEPKNFRNEETIGPPVTINMVPLRAAFSIAGTYPYITIGDQFEASFRVIQHKKAVIEDVFEETISFAPFTIIAPITQEQIVTADYLKETVFRAKLTPFFYSYTEGRKEGGIPPYSFEYHIEGDEKKHHVYRVPGISIPISSVFQSDPLNEKYPFVRVDQSTPSLWEEDLTRHARYIFYLTYGFALGVFLFMAAFPVLFVWGACTRSARFLFFVNRLRWHAAMRILFYRDSHHSRKRVVHLENTFRGYLASYLKISPEAAQSVILRDIVEKSSLLSPEIRENISDSLNLFYEMRRGRDSQALNTLRIKQELLKKSL